jgi:hypothetical protein
MTVHGRYHDWEVLPPLGGVGWDTSPPMAPGDARSPSGGDEGAGSSEVQSSMTTQHPLLRVLDGEGDDPVNGQAVLDAIGEVLTRLLPHVAADDPMRAALIALGCASGCRLTELQPLLEAL